MTCPVMIASPDADYGLCSAADAPGAAQALADSEQTTITIRDPVTDQVLGTVSPG